MTGETKVALVTGASSGLGRVIARKLASEGWWVGLVARRRERLDALASEIERGGSRAYVLAGDLRDRAFAAHIVSDFVARAGRLDLLVNNAGAPTRMSAQGPAGDVNDDEFDAAFALNVRSAYRLSYAALPYLQKTQGSIVNVSSAGVARNIPIDLVYLTSKGALEVLGRGMAKKWAPLGVRVNTVAPGMVVTEIMEAAGYPPDSVEEEVVNARIAFQPLPIAGRAEDIGTAVAFLASAQAQFVTGATLHVDGGMALGG